MYIFAASAYILDMETCFRNYINEKRYIFKKLDWKIFWVII